jgi:1-acyl-sn-glycerol-3-phosphate acyltransferase
LDDRSEARLLQEAGLLVLDRRVAVPAIAPQARYTQWSLGCPQVARRITAMQRWLMRFKAPHWDARLSPLLVRLTRPLRRLIQRRRQRLWQVEVRGMDRLRALHEQGGGFLLTPNHAGHADPFVMWEGSDALGRPFYFMAAWQVFAMRRWIGYRMLQRHGCFSVDREGTDLRAFKQAVKVLADEDYPLVIFPEGEVYHVNDRVTPFRDGPAVIALTAAKNAGRPVYAVPCAIKYFYLHDPRPQLETMMTELEQRILWRPQTGRPLAQRVCQFAEALLGLKEVEHLGSAQQGPLRQRVGRLIEHILSGLEAAHGTAGAEQSLPERVKNVRRSCLQKLDADGLDPSAIAGLEAHLEDAYFAVQLFSYPGDYVAERPTIERLAETIDKFEEDVFDRPYAQVRGARRAVLQVGEPIDVHQFAERAARGAQPRKAARPLTETLEQAVQALVTEVAEGPATLQPAS